MRMHQRSLVVLAVLASACGGGTTTATEPPPVEAKPVFSIVGTPVIIRSATTGPNSTTTAMANFNVRIQALGSDVVMNTSFASIPLADFGIYVNGVRTSLSVATATDYPIPVPGVAVGSTSFTIPQGNEVTIPLSFTFQGRTTTGTLIASGTYAVGLEAIRWSSKKGAKVETFMAGDTTWRTPKVVLP